MGINVSCFLLMLLAPCILFLCFVLAVFEVLSKLPRHGVGSRLSRTTWGKDSYYEITEVVMEQNGKRGKAYGILTWRGQRRKEEKGPLRIRRAAKKCWVSLDDDTREPATTDWPSFAAAALQKEQAEELESTSSGDGQDSATVEGNEQADVKVDDREGS